MLLNCFSGRFDEEAKRWDRVRTSIRTSDEVWARNELVRESLKELSGPYPARCPLSACGGRAISHPDYRIENILFQSRPDLWVEANLHLPAGAASGRYAVLTYNPIGQGERRQQWLPASEEFDSLFSVELEYALIGNLLALLGASSPGYFVWDGMRAVDYLLTRPEADWTKIGCAHHSDNGCESVLFCALDDRNACAALHVPNGSGSMCPTSSPP